MNFNLRELYEVSGAGANKKPKLVDDYTGSKGFTLKKISDQQVVSEQHNLINLYRDILKHFRDTYKLSFNQIVPKVRENKIHKTDANYFELQDLNGETRTFHSNISANAIMRHLSWIMMHLEDTAGIKISDYELTINQMKKKPTAEEKKLAEDVDVNVTDAETVEDIVKDIFMTNSASQIVLTGPPGTGKTYIANSVAESLKDESKGTLWSFVQFHPSFDYSDFVEGLRPFESDSGEMVFKKTDGIFKRFCREVAEKNYKYNTQLAEQKMAEDDFQAYVDGNEKHFFIIDEINRADVSKVFGELLFCLEADKRGRTVQTPLQHLPSYKYKGDEVVRIVPDVFKDGFFIPKNLYIIATMNDIDRSVESMDFALRRRFTWIQVDVTPDLLRSAFETIDFSGISYLKDESGIINEDMLEDLKETTIKAIISLNVHILTAGKKYLLNRNYFISQGYFSNLVLDVKDKVEFLKYVWDYKVDGVIYEYVRGEDSAEDFVKNAKREFLKVVASPTTLQPEEDAVPGQLSEQSEQGDQPTAEV